MLLTLVSQLKVGSKNPIPPHPLTSLHSLGLDVISEGTADVGVFLHHLLVPVSEGFSGRIRIARNQVDAEVGLVISVAKQARVTCTKERT